MWQSDTSSQSCLGKGEFNALADEFIIFFLVFGVGVRYSVVLCQFNAS